MILVDKVYSMGKNFQMDLSIYADIEALLKNTQACINISEVLHTSKVSKYTFSLQVNENVQRIADIIWNIK